MDVTQALRKELIEAMKKILPVGLKKLKDNNIQRSSNGFDISTITKRGYQP